MTAQCSLCAPGACHDDACPHALPKRAFYKIAAGLEEVLFDLLKHDISAIRISNDDVRHVPFGEWSGGGE